MIKFDVWIPQIIGYCEFIEEEAQLRQAWLEHDHSKTSVWDFSELIEQIFDDLDSSFCFIEFRKDLEPYPKTRSAIGAFLKTLDEFNTEQEADIALATEDAILRSPSWKLVREAAAEVVRVNGEEGNLRSNFRSS